MSRVAGEECGSGAVAMTGEKRVLTAVCSAELGAEVPCEVLVAPWGLVQSTSGTFVVDAEGAELAIRAFESQGTDLPIDYEHQTLGGAYASPSGQAPAAGWIRRLFLRAPGAVAGGGEAQGADPSAGLYAEVRWTEPARAQLATRQYRYLSPVVIVRKRDRRLVALHSAALTNKPAIVGMQAIVNRVSRSGVRVSDGSMVAQQPNARGHVDADSGESQSPRGDDAVTRNPEPETRNPISEGSREGAKAAKARSRRETEDCAMVEAVDRLRKQLGLEEASEAEAVLAAASERLSALTEAARRGEAEVRVLAAMEAGKLAESQREWALALAMRDPAGFEAWEASAPVVVQVGRVADDGGHGNRTAQDREVVAAKARAEFRSHPELELLTSEEAYVALAMREMRNAE